ncbi:alpha/beta hydrolase [Kribbella sp. CA-293567]|uniref:alpha/beta hydrolase n=1 Tax=Kribbella sp. CA-293567 TaxID=3002436 RepID=UPI0022DD910E|nr:alpha/beta hydrolase [Kribbella sp. CA-293567]WBQ03446.1 alpha/beta hydrolase [Kribbella sp. CA-293567]
MKTMQRSVGAGIPRRFTGLAISVALTVAAVVGGNAAAADQAMIAAAPPAVAAPRIVWGPCPMSTEDPRLICGTVKVPLDYRNPGGEQIEVAVSKLPAAKSSARRGVLLLNPGGPALPGLDAPVAMAPTLPPSVLAAYDLIGFDPRGVEHSTPQSCGLDDPSLAGLFPYPAADGSITANVKHARTTAERCLTNAGQKLRHFTTANTARDLDRIRTALGEKKISFWGQSYGTYLGTVYASLFPKRADRVVLEGNVDPTKVWANAKDNWGKAMSERFPDAAKVAAAQHATLGLGGTVDEVTQKYLVLADRLDRAPAPVPGTSLILTGSILRTVTYSLLLQNEALPVLAQFWKAAVALADGTLTEADGQVLQQVFAAPPPTPGVPADNQATMFLALTCGDAPWSNDVHEYARRTAEDRRAWPLTAGMPANIWPCAFWPKPIEKPVRVTDQGPRNILILQNRRDNATPWEDGLGLYEVLGKRAAFVGAENGGHYVYDQGSSCVDKATVAFLTTGRLPGKKVYCTDVAPQ